MAQTFADENLPLPVVEELRRLGHDVLTMSESGLAGQRVSDPEVLAFARAEQRVLLTLNRWHFVQLHRKDPSHTGIIACSVDPDFVALARRIHLLLEAEPDLSNQLRQVNRPA